MIKLKQKVSELSEIERKLLSIVEKEKNYSFEELIQTTSINPDSVRRATAWLMQKGFFKGIEKKETKLELTSKGQNALNKGLPEKRMLSVLKEKNKMSFSQIQKKANLEKNEFNAALGLNKKNAFIIIIKEKEPMIELTTVGEEFAEQKNDAEKILREIQQKGKSENFSELLKRGLIEEIEKIKINVSLTQEGIEAKKLLTNFKQRSFVLDEAVKDLHIGKKQPYIQFLNQIRRKLTELGFTEMYSPLIVQEFYNFDVLYQPQNHPARTWTDTYQLKNPKKGKLPDKKKVKAIKNAHEHGGISASTGWKYDWVESIAEKMMPAAHGTAHSARQLVMGIQNPGKYFAIARCFRPDVMDATHLIEFNQTEGFIVGENLNFKHLLGMLKDFAIEIAGAEEVKFFPDYYPFTEPSVQISAKHPKLGWIELGGAGMFRPEILENLGIKGQAIAWGIGIDRLAMFKLGIKDIRMLFSQDLQWLRNSKTVID